LVFCNVQLTVDHVELRSRSCGKLKGHAGCRLALKSDKLAKSNWNCAIAHQNCQLTIVNYQLQSLWLCLAPWKLNSDKERTFKKVLLR